MTGVKRRKPDYLVVVNKAVPKTVTVRPFQAIKFEKKKKCRLDIPAMIRKSF